MQFLGVRNGIEKAIIKANGISIAAVIIELQVGELARSSFEVPPELAADSFSYGQKITITIEQSKSASGVVFRGEIIGIGFSNMTGSVSCRIDLIHEVGNLLDSSSTLFPGNMPGSASDNEAYIKFSKSGPLASSPAGNTLHPLYLLDDFGNDVKNSIAKYIEYAAEKSGTGMERPIDYQRIIQAINQIESMTGQIAESGSVQGGITESLNAILKSASISSTFWNVLSSFFSYLDLVLVCKADGGIMIMPNYSGIKATANYIPDEMIISFDQNSRYERTPKSIVILVSDIPPLEVSSGGDKSNQVGKAIIESAPPSSHGVFCVEAPSYLRSMTQFTKRGSVEELMNKYAQVIGSREIGKLMLCNVSTPLCLGVFPGVPVSFRHLTSIKTFSGQNIEKFNNTFDGYCNSIRHTISTEGIPKTLFSFTNVTDGIFKKESVHPLWPGAQMPAW